MAEQRSRRMGKKQMSVKDPRSHKPGASPAETGTDFLMKLMMAMPAKPLTAEELTRDALQRAAHKARASVAERRYAAALEKATKRCGRLRPTKAKFMMEIAKHLPAEDHRGAWDYFLDHCDHGDRLGKEWIWRPRADSWFLQRL